MIIFEFIDLIFLSNKNYRKMKVSRIDINSSEDRPRLLWLIGLNKCLQKSAIATKYELQMSMIIFGSQMRQ